MKKSYEYFYYRLYKHFEKGGVWMTEWKASLAMDVFTYFIIASVMIYYKIFYNRGFHLSERNYDVLGMVLIVAGFNYFVFHHKNNWRQIVQHYEQLDKNKQRIRGWIVFSVVILILANLLFSFYLMSKIDWSQYR